MYDKDPDLTAIGGWLGLWLIIFIIIRIIIAVKFGEIAEIKGHSSSYGWWVFFFGIIGIIMVAVLPDREASVSVINEVRIKADDRQKPYIHVPKQNDELPEI